MSLGEEGDEIVGHRGTDTVDIDQIAVGFRLRVPGRRHRAPPFGERAVVLGEQARRRLAHLADAERVDEAVEADGGALADGGDEIFQRFRAPPLARLDVGAFLMKPEDVGRRGDQPVLAESLDMLGPQPLDIEGVAGDEVLQPFDGLRRADQAAGAAPGDLSLLAHGAAAAFRAGLGQDEAAAAGGAFLGSHRDHLGNHVAGPLHHHGIAGTDVLAGDLVLVVKGGARHHDTADGDRFEPRHRGQRARAAHLNGDLAHHRPRPLGGELVGDRPARRAADETEPLLPVQAVDLVDDAVDVVGQFGAPRLDLAVEFQACVDVVEPAGQGIGGEPPAPKPFEKIPMGLGDR